MLIFDAQPTQPFNRRRRLAAFHTKRRLETYQAGPTFRTCPSPPTLLNRSVTMDACDWEQEIEDVIEQSAFGETQRANSVYRTWVDFHPRFFLVNGRGPISKFPHRLLCVWKIVNDRERSVDLLKQQHPRQ